MPDQTVLTAIDDRGTATVTLNRPALHNAFDDVLIARLTAELETLARNAEVRVVVLAGKGRSFSAGADLNWMHRMAGASEEENLTDAKALATLLHTLAVLPKPSIALVHGAAFGGGVGLVAACDIAIASQSASFCLSEVRLGLVPSVIGPYIVDALGPRNARRYILSAERFDAAEALRIGLVHEVVADDELGAARDRMLDHLSRAGPEALAVAKALIARLRGRAIDDGLIVETTELIARLRASPEAREGVDAFLEKRKPSWCA